MFVHKGSYYDISKHTYKPIVLVHIMLLWFSWVYSKPCLKVRSFCFFSGDFIKSIPWSQTWTTLLKWINIFPFFCWRFSTRGRRKHTFIRMQTSLPRKTLVAGSDRDSINQFRAPFSPNCSSWSRICERSAWDVTRKTKTGNIASTKAS